MAFNIVFNQAATFTPFEGGGDLYPFEGKTFGTISNVTEDKSEKGNDQLVLDLVCDEQEAKGLKARKWIPVSGTRTDGKPNIIALYEALAAINSMCGGPNGEPLPSDAAVAKVRELEGRSVTSDQLIAALKGKRVCYEVAARTYAKQDGTTALGTEVKNFIMKSTYDDNKALNTHHRQIDEATVRARAGGGGGGGQAAAPNLGGGNPLAGSVMGGQPNGAAPAGQPAAAPTKGALGIL
jgi:hypothetical protein